MLIHEYADLLRDLGRAASWGDRWRYLMRAPGWSTTVADKRAKTLRAEAGL